MKNHAFALIMLFTISFSLTCCQRIYNCNTNSSCGCSNRPAAVSRIVGGENASPQTWGWIVSLQFILSGSHFCGGSIIAPSYILTAAHCTAPLPLPSLIRVHVGSIDSSVPAQVRNVAKIINHPSYSELTHLNDIGILKLSQPLDLSRIDLDQICLPNVSSAVLARGEYPIPGIDLVAIGWGVLGENDTTVVTALQQVTVQSISVNSSYCRNASLLDPATQFCAGTMPMGGKDTCQGDSGGPIMMFTSTNVWEQVGVVSYGIGCARPGVPGIYTRVAAYQQWINATINSANQIKLVSNAFCVSLFLFIIQ